MNKDIVAVGYRTSERVRIRTGRGEKECRRMWGGIAWPEFPDHGAVCIVAEIMPNKEDVELGALILLDQETWKTIEDLLKKTIDLKDWYYARRFFADARNEGWMDKFTLAHGLTRYNKDKDVKMFSYYREDWLTAPVDEAPQADNPEFGLQLINDWLYNTNKLRIKESVQKEFEKERYLPITKDRLKTGIPPVIRALGFVLSAYFQRPFRSRKKGSVNLSNWQKKHEKKESSYEEYYVK